MNDRLQRIEAALDRFVPERAGSLSETVNAAMRYTLLDGGKRARAIMTLAFAELCGGTEAAAMPYACAIEMVHAYSLIHDDLPCMDNDDLRRGKPSNHKVYGEAQALIAGDGLLTKAFETALCPEAVRAIGAERAAKAAYVLAECAGECGMVGGQCIDLETEEKPVTLETLQEMDIGKTSNLFMAACMMGVIAGGGTDAEIEAAKEYALHIGLAFQIRDDILDAIGDAETLGKNTGVDTQNGRGTYVTMLGVERAQELVEENTAEALQILGIFHGDKSFLEDFAMKMVWRTK